MRELQSLTASLVNQGNDSEVKTALRELAEEFRYSDPLTSDKTSDLEENMHNQLGDLQQALVDGDMAAAKTLCTKLLDSVRERNRICSLNK